MYIEHNTTKKTFTNENKSFTRIKETDSVKKSNKHYIKLKTETRLNVISRQFTLLKKTILIN